MRASKETGYSSKVPGWIWRLIEKSELQKIPNSKIQIPKKIPNSNFKGAPLQFGPWDLVFGVSLELGCWCLVLFPLLPYRKGHELELRIKQRAALLRQDHRLSAGISDW